MKNASRVALGAEPWPCNVTTGCGSPRRPGSLRLDGHHHGLRTDPRTRPMKTTTRQPQKAPVPVTGGPVPSATICWDGGWS